MRGTFVYDIITTVGVILLVFLIMYWAVEFGTEMVAGMLLSDPAVIQGALASGVGFSCRPYDYVFNFSSTTTLQADVDLSEKTIQIVPPAKKPMSDWSGAERGGTKYKTIDAVDFVSCNDAKVVPSRVGFEKEDSASFAIIKKEGSVSLEVR